MGWPLARSTKAAASRALSFSDAADSAAGDLAGRFFFAAGAGVVETRFFLAGMASLLGRKLAREAAPVAPLHQGQEDYLDRAPTSREIPAKATGFSGRTDRERHSTCRHESAGVARRSFRQRRRCSCKSGARLSRLKI